MVHIPVLRDEVIKYWLGDPHGFYIDCTLGGDGHLRELLPHLKADARVLGIDKDGEVLRETARTLAHPGLRLVHGDFGDLDQFLDEDENGQAEGILMDLGVSSFQLDEGERGFSYHAEAELDMRMDREQPIRAADLVNQLPQEELSRIIFAYGEERFARQIARAIAKTPGGFDFHHCGVSCHHQGGHTGPLPARQAPCAPDLSGLEDCGQQ